MTDAFSARDSASGFGKKELLTKRIEESRHDASQRYEGFLPGTVQREAPHWKRLWNGGRPK